jgi:hypothetical protein
MRRLTRRLSRLPWAGSPAMATATQLTILHGLFANGRITDTGGEAAKLAECIQSKDCSLAAALTGAGKAKLRAFQTASAGTLGEMK